jgi:hypothetical protein
MATTYIKNGLKTDTLTVTGSASIPAISTTGTADFQGAVFALDNIETGITAHAGGTQAAAYALTKVVSVVNTVGTAADSVKLPAPTKVGQIAIVVNNAATNSMQVFGSGTDTINGVATATGVAQAAGKTAVYVAASTGTAAAWFRLLSA